MRDSINNTFSEWVERDYKLLSVHFAYVLDVVCKLIESMSVHKVCQFDPLLRNLLIYKESRV